MSSLALNERSGSPLQNADSALVGRALERETGALRELVDRLAPVIQARVVRVLVWRQPTTGRDVRQEVEDLTQEVFLALFCREGRLLRTWRPERGLSLRNFVGLVAERLVQAILQAKRGRNPWVATPAAPETLARQVAAPQQLDQLIDCFDLLDRLLANLSMQGRAMFRRLVVEQKSVAQVCRETGMAANTVHAWHSRLRKLARQLREDDARDDEVVR